MPLAAATIVLALGGVSQRAPGPRGSLVLGRRALLAAPLALGAAPRAARARGCDPTTGEQCRGNFWETGELTFSKEAQMREFAASGDADRTIIRLTGRLQRDRAALVALGPRIVLGDIGGARRALREPPFDGVRKASMELVGLKTADSKAARIARDKLKRFTNALDKLDSQLLRAGRGELEAAAVSADFEAARAALDGFLAEVGVPLAQEAAQPAPPK